MIWLRLVTSNVHGTFMGLISHDLLHFDKIFVPDIGAASETRARRKIHWGIFNILLRNGASRTLWCQIETTTWGTEMNCATLWPRFRWTDVHQRQEDGWREPRHLAVRGIVVEMMGFCFSRDCDVLTEFLLGCVLVNSRRTSQDTANSIFMRHEAVSKKLRRPAATSRPQTTGRQSWWMIFFVNCSKLHQHNLNPPPAAAAKFLPEMPSCSWKL